LLLYHDVLFFKIVRLSFDLHLLHSVVLKLLLQKLLLFLVFVVDGDLFNVLLSSQTRLLLLQFFPIKLILLLQAVVLPLSFQPFYYQH